MSSVPEPKNVIYGLSCTCHPEDGVRYVGQTSVGARKRFYHHIHRAVTELADYPVSRWIRKHGASNIVVQTLEVFDTPDGLDEAETRWIKSLGVLVEDGGLNLWPGGGGTRGYKQRPERKMGPGPGEKLRQLNRERMTGVFGSKSPRSTTTEQTVSLAKRDIWGGDSRENVANRYGVSFCVIHSICQDKSWTHVDWPIGPRVAPKRKRGARDWRIHGEECGSAKLTESDVRTIRSEYIGVRGQAGDIARRYGVTSKNILLIVSRKTWKHVV